MPAGESPVDFTLKAVGLGILFGIIFGAANAFLGLRDGLAISTSIPVAVMTLPAMCDGLLGVLFMIPPRRTSRPSRQRRRTAELRVQAADHQEDGRARPYGQLPRRVMTRHASAAPCSIASCIPAPWHQRERKPAA